MIAGYVPQPRCLPSNIARLGAQGPLLQPVKKALDQSIVHIFRRNVLRGAPIAKGRQTVREALIFRYGLRHVAQAGCRAAKPALLASITPANLSSTRRRLTTLAQVFGLIPFAAGRTLRRPARMQAARAPCRRPARSPIGRSRGAVRKGSLSLRAGLRLRGFLRF